MNKKTSKEIRKMIFIYTSNKQRFTQLAMKKELGLTKDNVGSQVSLFMAELVEWGYLTAVKEGTTILYYRI